MISIPLIVLQGEKDRICSKEKMVQLLEKCSSDEINLKMFKDGFHNLHLGKDKESLQACVLNWIKSNGIEATPLGPVPVIPNRKSNSRRNFGILKFILLLFLYFKGLQMFCKKCEKT